MFISNDQLLELAEQQETLTAKQARGKEWTGGGGSRKTGMKQKTGDA